MIVAWPSPNPPLLSPRLPPPICWPRLQTAALLGAGADPDTTNRKGHAPLHMAALNGDEQLATFVAGTLKNVHGSGRGLERRDKHGNTALHIAAQQGMKRRLRFHLRAAVLY